MASGGKHSANRLNNYLEIHQTRMHGFRVEGFVLDDGLKIDVLPDGVLMEGMIECLGGIQIKVRKKLLKLTEEDDPLVKSKTYSYNVAVRGRGTIFRYDSPYPDPLDAAEHHREHHVHRNNPLEDNRTERVEILGGWEEVPTLSEIIEEAREWYYAHIEKLRGR